MGVLVTEVFLGRRDLFRFARTTALARNLEPLGDGICGAHLCNLGRVVLNVRYGFDVGPDEFATVEDEVKPALGVIRVEKGMCAD